MSRFDEVIDRRNTDCAKYDCAEKNGKPADILPLWVADMDFQTPEEVIVDLIKATSHGIFGYPDVKTDYFDAVLGWFNRRFGWEIQPEWLVKTPGVVFAISTAIRAFTSEGDGVLILQPVYAPFFNSVHVNHRKPVISELLLKDGSYSMDFEDMERKIIAEKVKLFVFCSPHNPVGRVWTTEELRKVGELCLKHNVLLVSDEIHCDFTYPGVKHHMLASLDKRFAQNTITCTAPSKTFNLAGLQASNIFIPNEGLHAKFSEELKSTGYGELNTLAVVACRSAYQHGEAWVDELRGYLQGNLDYVRSFLAEHLPQIKLIEPQGTYLIWLDCRELHLSEEALENLMVNQAKIWLNEGTAFGKSGSGFERVNIGCPRATLMEAMTRLERAVKAMK